MQSFWPRCSSTHRYLFSLTVLRGSTSAANRRLFSAYSWPERQPANRQKTITPMPTEELEASPYTLEEDLDVCSCLNPATTLHTKYQRSRKVSYQAITEYPHWGRRLYPVTTAWSSHCLQISSLKRSLDLLKQQNHFRKYCGSRVFERSLFSKTAQYYSVWKLFTDWHTSTGQRNNSFRAMYLLHDHVHCYVTYHILRGTPGHQRRGWRGILLSFRPGDRSCVPLCAQEWRKP